MVTIVSNVNCIAAHEFLGLAVQQLDLAKATLERGREMARLGRGFTMSGAALVSAIETLALRVEELAGDVMSVDNPEIQS